MPKIAHLNAIWAGVCVCHNPPIPMSGPIITASTDSTVNNQGIATVFDTVSGGCGHTGMIITGSLDIEVNDKSVALVGDVVTGCCQGTIVTGSNDSEGN